MFNKGRPKKHVNISFFTYEARDGAILSYEMNSKGPLKSIGNQKNIILKTPPNSETNEQQPQIIQQNTIQNPTENQNVQIQNFTDNNQIEEQNVLSNDMNFENCPFDDFLYNYDGILNNNDMSNQNFGGFSDFNGSFMETNLNEDFYFKF